MLSVGISDFNTVVGGFVKTEDVAIEVGEDGDIPVRGVGESSD